MMRTVRVAVFGVVLLSTLALGSPRPARCASGICLAAPCLSASSCPGTDCICLRQGVQFGECYSIDRAEALLVRGWTELE